MSTDRARLLREWFEAACDLPEREWTGFLQGCEDVPLRAEVLDLLQRDRAPDQPLDDPLLSAAQREALLALAGDSPQPARIGPYEVVRVIGRGSMGTVYEARAPDGGAPVAIKVLRMGLPTRALLHRFRREAEILERLEHPCIARILQSGTTQVGLATLPFIAMELVAGRPLDQYCKEERLKLRARLELLAQIGEAVQHAHGRGVVHRDLKPSNILVDADGRPHVLDFGVARATSAPGGPASLHTATGQLVGTLQYMSPEQTLGDPSAVDPRSDVYALGAIAYRLLAGRPPYEVSGCSFDEALRRVRHDPPPPLDRLSRPLRSRVEVVLGRALEKERTERYPSAQAFVDDLRALRDGRPSAARAPSVLQQLRRMARRDPRAFRAAAIFAGLLLLGIAGTSWGWLVASARQRDVVRLLEEQRAATAAADAARADAEDARTQADGARAEAEDARIAAERSGAEANMALRESEAVVAFLEGMFRAVEPENLGSRILLADALLLAAPDVEAVLAEAPQLGARLHRTLASAFLAVGRPDLTLEHLDAADLQVAEPPTQLRTRLLRGRTAVRQGRYAEAITLLQPLCADVPAEETELRVTVVRELAVAQGSSGDITGAAAQLEGLLGPDGHVPGVSTIYDERVRLDLANLETMHHATAAAEATIRDVLQARTERLGPEQFETVEAMDRLGLLLAETDRVAEAEELYVRCVEYYTRTLGPEHPHTIYQRARLVALLTDNGRAAEVLSEIEQLLAISRRVVGPEHQRTVLLLFTLGRAAHSTGRGDAQALLEEAVAMTRRVMGNDNLYLLRQLSLLGLVYSKEEGRREEGIALMREALAIAESNSGANPSDQLMVKNNLAGALMSSGRYEEARPLVETALAGARELMGDTNPRTVTFMVYLATLCHHAEEWPQARALDEEALRTLPANTEQATLSRARLAISLLHLDELAEGEKQLRTAIAEAEQLWGPDHELAVYLRTVLAAVLAATP